MANPLNDEPTLHDRLGREGLVERVGDEIANCEPPCVFGIHGEWGGGKTSFLHQLHWHLTGDCPEQTEAERKEAKAHSSSKHKTHAHTVEVVWFEAWRYQHEANPIIALLHEIRTQLTLYSKWLNEAGKLTNVAIRGALLSMEDLTKRIGFSASKIQRAGEDYERENLAVALPSHTIREHLNDVLDQLLGKKSRGKRRNARLVVLIDDLDRCEPKAALKLIEGIKIYLNLPSCVFVLGMDRRIIERAVAEYVKSSEMDESRHEYAREYLDKLCTHVWHLPLLHDPTALLEVWLPDWAVRPTFVDVVGKASCLAANPRKIKSFVDVLRRFVEHFGSHSHVGAGKNLVRHAQLTVFMAGLYHDHPELYRRIENDPGFYYVIRDWARGGPAKHELLEQLKVRIEYAETDATEQDPTPARVRVETYPDPVRGNVFRLQSLIEELGEVTVNEIRSHLLFKKTT